MARHYMTLHQREERLKICLEGLGDELLVSGVLLVSDSFYDLVKIFDDSRIVARIGVARDADLATIQKLAPQLLQPLLERRHNDGQCNNKQKGRHRTLLWPC